MKLALSQKAAQESSGWWAWSVELAADDADLRRVREVTYTLHPTFNNPVRTVTDAQSRFSIRATGWGEFMVYADVRLADGSEVPLRHWLRLKPVEPGPRRTVLLTCAKEDDATTDSLQESLETQGYGVERILGSSVPDGACAYVAVVSAAANPWLAGELAIARSAGLPVLALTCGDASPPACLARFTLRDPSRLTSAAEWLQQLLTRPAPWRAPFWQRRLTLAEADLARAARAVLPLLAADGRVVAAAVAISPTRVAFAAPRPWPGGLKLRLPGGDLAVTPEAFPDDVGSCELPAALPAHVALAATTPAEPLVLAFDLNQALGLERSVGWLTRAAAPNADRLVHDASVSTPGAPVFSLESGLLIGLQVDASRCVPATRLRALLRERLPAAAGDLESAAASVAEDDLEKASAADYADRKGYDPAFLGLPVPLPRTSKEVKVLPYTNFSVGMHPPRRMALYTAVNLGGRKLVEMTRDANPWRFDPRLPRLEQLGDEFYTGTPLDRGHMVRRLDPVWGSAGEQAESDTFHFTNSCPQHRDLNRKTWSDLEDYVYLHAKRDDLKVSVFTGPVLRPDDPAFHGARLPSEFWKVVVIRRDDTRQLSATAYLLSQQDMVSDLEFVYGEFRTYQVSIAAIEKKTGLDFGELRRFDPKAKSSGLEAAAPPAEIKGPQDLELGLPLPTSTPAPPAVALPRAAASRWHDPAQGEQALTEALNTFDWASAEALVRDLIVRVQADAAGLDDPLPRRLLGRLRRKRRFTDMIRLADAFILAGIDAAQVRRQYAQALIDQGIFSAAEVVLRALVSEATTPRGEISEAQGLLGRLCKQAYVNARAPGNPRNQARLQQALNAYWLTYALDRSANFWHGINVVAVLARAERDGLRLTSESTAAQTAAQILATLEARERESSTGELNTWESATALEAHLALGQFEAAVRRAKLYAAARDADAFEIASTLRQLEEVWQLDDTVAPGDSLLPILRAALLERQGGCLQLSPQAARHNLEKVFGTDRSVTLEWYQAGLSRARSIARIECNGKGVGTGWLIRSTDLGLQGPERRVLITNAHVIGPPTPDRHPAALRPEEAEVRFQMLDWKRALRPDAVVFHSPVQELDATVVELPDLPKAAEPLEPDFTPIAITEPPPRLYVIGHPGGRDLEFALQDNYLLGVSERLVHYRTPTEGGSSGSPVFGPVGWKVVALHHAGRREATRIDGKPGTYEANEGIVLSAIRQAIRSRSRDGA